MKVGILETGTPIDTLIVRFGRYPHMLQKLIGERFEATIYDVPGGELPAAAADHDAYLITGSPAGVYDPLPWISELIGFLKSAKGEAKLVGICFGHQVMAEAFGGRVVKSEKGWGVGLHTYPVLHREPWMDGEETIISVPASHQDQVVEQPPETIVLAGSVFTPFAALAYRDQPAISFQFHPEFEPEYAKAMIETRRDRLTDPDAAIASLDRPNDSARVGGWIRRFLLS